MVYTAGVYWFMLVYIDFPLQLSKVNSTDLCSQCWSKIALGGEMECPTSSPPTSQNTGPLSSQALLTNLRAIWKSSPQTANKELTWYYYFSLHYILYIYIYNFFMILLCQEKNVCDHKNKERRISCEIHTETPLWLCIW